VIDRIALASGDNGQLHITLQGEFGAILGWIERTGEPGYPDTATSRWSAWIKTRARCNDKPSRCASPLGRALAATRFSMANLATILIGLGAALCSMGSFAPQLWKIWREKDASAVSLVMYVITATGFALWIAYGVALKSWPLVGSNCVCLVMALAILALRLRYGEGAQKA